MSEMRKVVSTALKQQHKWDVDPFPTEIEKVLILVNDEAKLALWVGNGPFFLSVLSYHEMKGEHKLKIIHKFNLFERVWLYYQMKAMIFKHMKKLKAFKQDLHQL